MSDGTERPDHSHLVDFPEALEVFFGRMRELRVVLGPQAAAGVDQIEALLREGLAARDRGDFAGGIAHVAEAMDRLAELAGRELPAEAPVLRAMARQFEAAMRRGAMGEAKQAAAVMRERSGSVLRPKKDR